VGLVISCTRGCCCGGGGSSGDVGYLRDVCQISEDVPVTRLIDKSRLCT